MALTASTNTTANTALRYLDRNNDMAASSLSKLSSGSRIVRASDDAASLAIGTKIKADVTALKQAQVNAGQASSVLQVADGAMSQTVDILMRMKALSVQSQSGSVSDNERGFLDKEFQALRAQIDDIANQTKFNGTTLLNGSVAKNVDATAATNVPGTIAIEFTGSAADGVFTLDYADAAQVGTFTLTAPGGATYTATIDTTGGGTFSGTLDFGASGVQMVLDTFAFTDSNANDFNTNNTYDVTPGMSFQVGINSNDAITVSLNDLRSAELGGDVANADGSATLVDATLADADGIGAGTAAASVATRDEAIVAGNILDQAISKMNENRADIGALISRFDFASANLAITVENLDAARSVLLDVDMAAEMSNFSSKQVLMQASVAMLAQANQMPQQLLKLLG